MFQGADVAANATIILLPDFAVQSEVFVGVIAGDVVVELKTVETFTDVHFAQVLTYLKIGNFHLGLLLNFNVLRLKDGIKRFIL